MKHWTTPRFEDFCMNAEIGSYQDDPGPPDGDDEGGGDDDWPIAAVAQGTDGAL